MAASALLRSEMTGDITFLTLENLIQPDVKVSALNAPDAAAELLRTTGVNLVAIGFPKVYDKGADGVRTTLEALHDRNLLTIGAYNTQEEASAICIRMLDNVPVAFLHYTEALSSTGKKAMKSSGASYAVPLADADKISADIRLWCIFLRSFIFCFLQKNTGEGTFLNWITVTIWCRFRKSDGSGFTAKRWDSLPHF